MAARLAAAVVLAATASVLVNAVIAAIAHAAGASQQFPPLTPGSYAAATVIGVLAGALAWQVVRWRAADPSRVLHRLVPLAVTVSLVPDVIVGLNHSEPGTSWGAVTALMVMHVAVAAVSVPIFRRFLPLR
ncbi:DUF6069 family protein [Streptomyces sp. NPDC090445]|uniref:DUF6069 family protein n=1 Tax=Streptomyces sp. NPDC090445 TaxID=3365963 RepID=UPI0038280DB8